jgi:outer membrane biosynthesis protein TonB
MTRSLLLTVALALALSSCAKKEAGTAPAGSGQRATVTMRDGSKVAGAVAASSATEITITGDDRITRTIPMDQVQSVTYGEPTSATPATAAAPAAQPEPQAAPEPARKATAAPPAQPARPRSNPEPAPRPATVPSANNVAGRPAAAPQSAARTYEVPAGAEIAVRTNDTIDSATATEGETYSADVTKDVRDASGAVVIPRGSRAQIVINSASKGGAIRGASDLALDLKSVTVGGRPYRVETADISQKGKAGVGANKRTAEYTGGGAALGAIIGAIAGGGKGAAIGAGAGAGAGALTQIITKGKSIKVPVESVLTFRLESPLRITAD